MGIQVEEPAMLDALESHYPMLRGRSATTQRKKRRACIQFFTYGKGLPLEEGDTTLPDEVLAGVKRLRIARAMAGG